MPKKPLPFLFTLLIFCIGRGIKAQEINLSKNYLGLIPSVLVEPYDTINAVEVNFLPFLYEFRIGNNNDLGIQFRPILNYRFYEVQPGFSQIGATLAVNKYFLNAFKDTSWLKPQLGGYFTYAYNRLDKIQTMTLGVEPGAYMRFPNNISISINVQPGINYYPDAASRDFVGTTSGFKGHFGIIVHAGYNF